MDKTKIRWCEHTWNPFTGCSKVSPGCDHCYAETIATSPRFAKNFPQGFEPTFKPHKVGEPRRWRDPARVFTNSMSDFFHADFTDAQRDECFDVMLEVDRHHYLVLTKRPKAMHRYVMGWLERQGLDEVPGHIWLGASVESDRYVWRADWLRKIPALVRFLSCEPLLGPLPSLNLAGIGWVIVGGESGKDYRPMPHEWAVDLRDRCDEAGVAYFFKQSAAWRTEIGMELEGELIEEYPLPHPSARQPLVLGRYVGRHGQAAAEDDLLAEGLFAETPVRLG